MIKLELPKEKVTPEQQIQLNKLAKKFLVKSIWNGINYGFMMLVMNLIVYMAASAYLDGDHGTIILGAVIIGIFIARKMSHEFRQGLIELSQEAKKIIQK